MTRRTEPLTAVERSASVLDALTELGPAGVTEVANHTGMAKSTVHVHLATLVHTGLVVKEGSTYDLGLQLLDYGTQARERRGIFQHARPEVDKIAAETGEICNLMVEEGNRGVYLYSATGEEAVNIDVYAGREAYLHSTALGKAILAHYSRERVDEILDETGMPAVTTNTITERERFYEELERVGDEKVAFDDEENLLGLRCVAVPVLVDGTVQGGISISGPTRRMEGARYREDLVEVLKNAANVVEVNLAYT
jgi:DNA-binding IclR family transcriptional regulator